MFTFTYLAPLLLRAVWPTSGPIAGGTPVVVYGGGFSGSAAISEGIQCVFYPSVGVTTVTAGGSAVTASGSAVTAGGSSVSASVTGSGSGSTSGSSTITTPLRTSARVINNTAIECTTPSHPLSTVVSVGVTLTQHQLDVVNSSVMFTYVTPVQVKHTQHPVNTRQYILFMHHVNTPWQYILLVNAFY